MTIIKATLYHYHTDNHIHVYFSTRKNKFKVSVIVDEVLKHTYVSPDFTKDKEYSRVVYLDELYYTRLEDAEAQFLLTFDVINPTVI